MQWLPTGDWSASAAWRRGPRRAALLVWTAVIAAVSLPPWPGSVALGQWPEVTENSIGMKLVKIPSGEFEMGSNDTPTSLRKAGFDLPEAAGPWDAAVAPERPVHRVRITQPFLMGQTEVTQGQWRAVMESAPWTGRQSVVEGPNVAASYMSWDEAVEFCTRLTKLEQAAGKLQGRWRYRLPTEAEWEYACRAGTQTRFSFADDEAGLEDHVWSVANMAFGDGASAREVGLKRPNPWGLHDMHGNVWEWCGDWYDAGYYVTSPAVDPPGAATGSLRVIRGGGWTALPVRCRSSMRNAGSGSNRDRGVGFRVVRVASVVGPDGNTFGVRLAAGRLPVDAEPAAANGDELQGRWQVVSMDGQTGGFPPGLQFVVQGERWEYVDAPMNIKQKSGTLRVDPSARPKQLDLIAPPDIKAPNRAYAFWVSDGSPVRCLYDVQGDNLTITWQNPGTGQPRPAGMAGDGQFVIEHKRLRQ